MGNMGFKVSQESALLKFIRDAEKPVALKDIYQGVGVTRGTAHKHVQNLLKENRIKKAFSHTHSGFVYSAKGKASPVDETLRVKNPAEVSARILSLSRQFAKGKWKPKVTTESYKLPKALEELNELASFGITGSEIEQSKLDNIRTNLSEYYHIIESLRVQVGGILAEPELWDSKKFAGFMAKSGAKLEDFERWYEIRKAQEG